jgi:hypothetical protein
MSHLAWACNGARQGDRRAKVVRDFGLVSTNLSKEQEDNSNSLVDPYAPWLVYSFPCIACLSWIVPLESEDTDFLGVLATPEVAYLGERISQTDRPPRVSPLRFWTPQP